MKLTEEVSGRGELRMNLEKSSGYGTTVRVYRFSPALDAEQGTIYKGDVRGFSIFVEGLAALLVSAQQFDKVEVPKLL